MKQKPKPFKRGKSKYYYFYYYDSRGKRILKSTHAVRKWQAEEFISDFLGELERPAPKGIGSITFREYAEPFFDLDRCPHVRRLQEDGKSIGNRHVRESRHRLTKHILPDQFSDIPVAQITRGDVLDLRSRLREKQSDNAVNKIMKTLKTVFAEALYRQDIENNPASQIGNIKYEKTELGIFTLEELFSFFPADSTEPWKDIYDYTCFLLAATTGMRRGEILALKWRSVDFEQSFLQIVEAWKDRYELGKPKWNKTRIVPLSSRAVESLRRLKEKSKRTTPEDLVFCYADGKRFGDTWWQKRFRKAMDKAEINYSKRSLKPHSFRHTLNTVLRNAGQDPAKIRAALGWSGESIQENYTHWQIEHLQDQAKIVDNLFSPPETSPKEKPAQR